ncbi:hypothetical protein pb186bvf_006138 [Paramecium bursaria]
MRRLICKFRFGGGHGAHDYHVTLNASQTWISETSNKLAGIQGFKDEHYHPHEDHTDPFAHVKNQPYFSFNTLYFMDPYYHEDDHEPLMNEPHGYFFGEDPLSYTNSLDNPLYEYLAVLFGVIFVGSYFGINNFRTVGPQQVVLEQHVTRQMIEDQILKIRQDNADLEAELQALK